MSSALSSLRRFSAAGIRDGVKALCRRDDAGLDLLQWGRELLSDHFRDPPSAMHGWLADEIDAWQTQRGQRLNVIGPRGAAKSTLGTLAYPLRCALEGWEPYIWIVSDTRPQACLHLENIKTELIENELLHTAYPSAAGRGPLWRQGALALRNGIVIEAFGTLQRMRGRRRRQHRPTLIVCDDLQNDQHVQSARLREQTRHWFHGALLKAGDAGTNILNLATALHRDAIALELARTAGWRSRTFRAVEQWPVNMHLWEQWEAIYANVEDSLSRKRAREFYEKHRTEMEAGAVVLWPQREDLYTLMCLQAEACDELWDSFVDPREPFYDGDSDGTRWLALTDGAQEQAAGAAMTTEQELRAIRSQCRTLAATNEFAINGHENRISYIVGSGHTYRAVVKKHEPAPAALAAEVQSVLEEFIAAEPLAAAAAGDRAPQGPRRRGLSAVLRCCRWHAAGAIRRAGPGAPRPSNGPTCRPPASACSATPTTWRRVLAYFIEGQRVDAAEIQHRKANVDSNVKRGLPLFYPVVQEPQAGREAAAEHERAGRDPVGHRPDPQAPPRHADRRAAVRLRPGRRHASPTPRPAAPRRFAASPRAPSSTPYGNIEYDFPAAAVNAASYVGRAAGGVAGHRQPAGDAGVHAHLGRQQRQLRLDAGGRRARPRSSSSGCKPSRSPRTWKSCGGSCAPPSPPAACRARPSRRSTFRPRPRRSPCAITSRKPRSTASSIAPASFRRRPGASSAAWITTRNKPTWRVITRMQVRPIDPHCRRR